MQNLIIALAPQSTVEDAVRMVCERQCMYAYILDDSEELCAKITAELTPLAISTGIKGMLKEGKLC